MRGAHRSGWSARLVPQGRGSLSQARPHQAQVSRLWALRGLPGHLPASNASGAGGARTRAGSPRPCGRGPGDSAPLPRLLPPGCAPCKPQPRRHLLPDSCPLAGGGGGATAQYVYPKHGGHRGEEEAPAVTPTSLERGITKDGDELVTFLEPPEKHTLVGVWVGGCGRRRGSQSPGDCRWPQGRFLLL